MARAKRKQKFFDVNMPILKKETQLYAYDIDELEGKTIKYDLTRFLRGKSVLLKLKVHVKDGKAWAEPLELNLMPYFLRRMVRKGTNYVEDSFSAETKDSTVKIKPLLITRKKVSRAVRKALREKAREELKSYLKTNDTKTVFEEILKNNLQKPLSLKLKKIYPLSLCEIRVFEVEKLLPKKEEIVEEKNPKRKAKKE